MKKNFLFKILILFIILSAISGGHILYTNYAKQSRPPISVIIASDMHYLSPTYRGEYFKEPNAMFDGKLIHYSSEYFDAFLAEVVAKHPQSLILSGDITLNGSLKSHEEVVEKLNDVHNKRSGCRIKQISYKISMYFHKLNLYEKKNTFILKVLIIISY